jgi:two-component system CheB/CheR fusion protein
MTVSFEEVEPRRVEPIERTEIDIGDVSAEQLENLQQELQHSRENLQATIEELETTNEELQTTNEELVASNEELQSTNEELQSVNEELYTVNAELQDKIKQLSELANDVESLLEATDVGTVFLDEALRIRKFTPTIAALFDLLAQDVGRPISVFAHRIDDRDLMRDTQRVLDEGIKVEREVLNDEGRCFFLRILPYTVDGSPAGVVLTLVDMSALKEAENALFRERYLLRSLMEIVPDPIAFKDADGRYVRVNTAAARWLGLDDPTQAVGKRESEIRPGSRSSETEAGEERIVSTGIPTHGELEERLGADGRRFHLTSKLPLRDEGDCPVGTLSISRDITAQKQAENEAHEAVRRRDRFLALLSHELRNPLGAMSSAIQIVDDSAMPTALRKPFEVFRRQVRHMARMIDDLLDVSRVMQDRIELERQPLDLVRLLRACLQGARMRASELDIHIDDDLPDGVVGVAGDEHRIEQCIDNLLSNALRYSAAGTRVKIRLETADDETKLTVTDEGAGIEPDLLEAIFEPFVQSDQSLHRRAAGMGLGLSLVRAIVRRHGGRVEAHSAGLGTGASFTVRLPTCELDDRPRAPTSVNGQLDGMRVVVVEDDDDNREMVTAMLELGGCEVVAASDGREGVEVIERERPAVAVVDLGLPGIDGFELAARVRKTLDGELRLVAVSGYGQPEDRRRARQQGFDAHLVKPVAKDELFQTIASLLEAKR